MIDTEFWCWSTIHIVPQKLKEFPLASKGRYVAILEANFNTVFIRIRTKDFNYSLKWATNTRDCRTVWELECQKSRLINEGFKMNWENYQLILQMFNERFKEYSPYIR